MFTITDFKDRRVEDRPRTAWFAGTLVGILLLALVSWLSERERALEAKLAAVEARGPRLVESLAECPPPAPGFTDTVLLIVRATADEHPTVAGCSRIAERGPSRRAHRAARGDRR